MTELEKLKAKHLYQQGELYPNTMNMKHNSFADALLAKTRGRMVDYLYVETKLPVSTIRILLYAFDSAYKAMKGEKE